MPKQPTPVNLHYLRLMQAALESERGIAVEIVDVPTFRYQFYSTRNLFGDGQYDCLALLRPKGSAFAGQIWIEKRLGDSPTPPAARPRKATDADFADLSPDLADALDESDPPPIADFRSNS